MRMVVDFPEPFGPRKPYTLARGTVFAVVQTGSVARVVDVSGTVHHEETLSSTDPAWAGRLDPVLASQDLVDA